MAEERLAFPCATHPHTDYARGILLFLEAPTYRPQEFWDSGLRHNSRMYRAILRALYEYGIRLVRFSSGMEWCFGRVRVTALAPSVTLRNRYATHRVDMNNVSIVLRLEHHREEVVPTESVRYKGVRDSEVERRAGRSVVILGSDAEFDSWAQISEEFPRLERTSAHDPLVRKVVNLLACAVVKVSHRGSMHSCVTPVAPLAGSPRGPGRLSPGPASAIVPRRPRRASAAPSGWRGRPPAARRR